MRSAFLTTLVFILFVISVSIQSPAMAENPKTFDGAKFVKYLAYDQAVELSNDSVRVVLCPQIGGRVLEYSLNGINVLYLSDDEATWKPGMREPTSAGRFDIGPELIVPPRPVLWSGPWTAEITGNRSATLTSPIDNNTGVQLIRTFELSPESSRLNCTQTIVNRSDSSKEWCHWSRTFAVGKGICLIPTSPSSHFPNHYVLYEEGTLINMKPTDPNIRLRDGWLEILANPRRPKLGFDSSAGVIGYVAPNDLLFVKRFEVDRNRVYNDAAGITISVWYPNGPMVELEPIGPRESLKPGESASFTEQWWLGKFQFPTNGADLDLKQMAAAIANLKE